MLEIELALPLTLNVMIEVLSSTLDCNDLTSMVVSCWPCVHMVAALPKQQATPAPPHPIYPCSKDKGKATYLIFRFDSEHSW